MSRTPFSIISRRLWIAGAMLLAALAPSWAQQPLAPDPLLPMQIQTLALTPQQLKTEASFPIDSSATRIYVDVIATAPGLAITLGLPDGRTISPENAATAGGEYAYFHLDQGIGVAGFELLQRGHHYQYKIPTSGAGLYKVQAGAASLTEPAALIVQFSDNSARVSASANVRTRFFFDGPGMAAILGEPNRMVVTANEGGTAVTGSVVSVEIRPQQGPVTTIALLDNGEGADPHAGDGRYSGWFTPQALGDYDATASVEFPDRYQDPPRQGLPAEATGKSARLLLMHFPVVPAWGKLTGRIEDRGIDEDGDKRFEKIGFDVEVDVRERGRFAARVFLGKEGVSEQQFGVHGGQGFADLELGRQVIRVIVDVFELQKSGYEPPYQIRRVSLAYHSARGAFDVSELRDAGETKAYTPAQFEKPQIVITGPLTDRAVDEDGDGALDWLVVSVPVEVQTHPQVFGWHAELATPAGELIEHSMSSAHLGHSQNLVDLKFDGARIRRAGSNGPYVVRKFDFSSTDGSIYVATLGRTQSYEVTQFRAPKPRLVRVSDRSVKPGDEIVVGVDGADTNFRPGSEVRIAPGLDTDRPFVTKLTHLSFRLRVAETAAPGPHPLTIITNETKETVTLEDAFTVEPADAAEAAPPEPEPSSEIAALEKSARLTGGIRERTIDKDGDGVLEAFALEAELEVAEPGNYAVQVQLEAPDKTRIQQRAGTLVSEPGTYWVTIPIPARVLYQLGESFQLAIRQLLVSVERGRGSHEFGTIEDLGQTQRYELKQFEPPSIALAGEISEQAVDDNGDGLFERLVVTVPIEKRRRGRGDVSFSAVLASANGKWLDSIGGAVPLEVGVGRIELAFDGVKIRAQGVDGPFFVQKFNASYGDQISVDKLLETRPYRSEQFQSSRPELLSVKPTQARPGETVEVEIRGSTTRFSSAASRIAAGDSITVRPNLVAGSELIRATFQVDPNANPGPRTISVTTGGETVTLRDAFRVLSPEDTARQQARRNPPKGKLTGEVRDRGVDQDGNGLFEKFVIDVGVELATAGDYSIWLFFTRNDGSQESLGFQQKMEAGSQTISVPFPAYRIHAMPDLTPYTVVQIFLVPGDGKGMPPIDRINGVWKTGEYPRASFEPPRLVVPANATERAVDDDGDGLFDRLLVSLSVEVKQEIDPAAQYTWRLALGDSAGKYVAEAEGGQTLKIGLNAIEIAVDGAAIRKSDADGPYKLGPLRLRSADGSMLMDNLGTTQAYKASQFRPRAEATR